MTWLILFAHSPDMVLAIFASLPYDAADYIHTYAEFRSEL
jgi:hypothetical protein